MTTPVKTPGQVAFEGYGTVDANLKTWDNTPLFRRKAEEAGAAAVLAEFAPKVKPTPCIDNVIHVLGLTAHDCASSKDRNRAVAQAAINLIAGTCCDFTARDDNARQLKELEELYAERIRSARDSDMDVINRLRSDLGRVVIELAQSRADAKNLMESLRVVTEERDVQLKERDSYFTARQTQYQTILALQSEIDALKAAAPPAPELVPFDMARFTAGERDIRYREGSKPIAVFTSNDIPVMNARVISVVGERALHHDVDGFLLNTADRTKVHPLDLLMPAVKPKVKKLWLAVGSRPVSTGGPNYHHTTVAHENQSDVSVAIGSRVVCIEIPTT